MQCQPSLFRSGTWDVALPQAPLKGLCQLAVYRSSPTERVPVGLDHDRRSLFPRISRFSTFGTHLPGRFRTFTRSAPVAGGPKRPNMIASAHGFICIVTLASVSFRDSAAANVHAPPVDSENLGPNAPIIHNCAIDSGERPGECTEE